VVAAYARRRYALLFYSLLLTIGAAPLLGALGFSADLLQFFLALNLLAAAGGVGRRRWAPVPLVAVALLIRLAAAWMQVPALSTTALAIWTAIALLATAGALRYAMRATEVDTEHVYAALSAYLLGGVFFGVLHWTIEQAWPGAFTVAGGPPAPGEFSLSSGIYFSFVTLATLGYGDVVPRSEAARGLSIVEAVAGQLYLAVMVARLVSLYVRETDGGAGPHGPGSPGVPQRREMR
jgi:hypothetical protein